MTIFEAPSGIKIRVYAKLIRWSDHGIEKILSWDTFYEGVTTDRFFVYKGVKRRLIINHNLGPNFPKQGIWQSDKQCQLVKGSNHDSGT